MSARAERGERRLGDDAAELERWRTDWSHGNIVARSDVSGRDAVICCDHLGPAWPSCEHSGCGLVTLGELVECFSSPHTYEPPHPAGTS